MTLPARADAVVIGAGVAGLSAAVRLADAGRSVVVVEQAPRPGGRTTSFVDRESGEAVDNGQHALFGCYRETYAFLGRIGAADRAPLQPTLSLAMADDTGRRATLTCPNLPPPWHLLAGLMRWRALSVADRVGSLRLASFLRQVRRMGPQAVAEAVPADWTVADWLTARGQSPAIREWLWNPLAFAALNQAPEVSAAAPFVRVLGELFAPDPKASAIGLPATPLADLFCEPATAFVEARGGRVVTRTAAVVALDSDGRLRGVRAGGQTIDAPVVVSAVPWHAFGRIWDDAPPPLLAGTAASAAAMRSSPIVTAHLWFESAPSSAIGAPFLGLTAGPMHWVFDRSAIVGGGARHVSLVASGAEEIARLENDRISAIALEQLGRAAPAIRSLTLRRALVIREHRATFSLAPGGPPRPSAKTPLAGFFLAGDWTDTGLPATIESAARSGHAAAALALVHNR